MSEACQPSPSSMGRETSPLEEGQRCDRALMRWLGVSRKHLIQKWIRKGNVHVNGRRAQPHQRLALGDKLHFPALKPELQSTQPKSKLRPTPLQIQRFFKSLHIHYEDEDLLVLEKPAGCPAHSGSGHPFGALEALQSSKPEWHQMALAHRIDKVTSGLLLCAKNPLAARRLHEQFRQRQVIKLYHALVHHQTPEAFEMDTPIQKLSSANTKPFEGQEALTLFQCEKRFKVATLLLSKPLTGRNHQIRKHLAEAGFAILGDAKYEEKVLRQASYRREALRPLPRNAIFLHASTLQFEHPLTTQPIRLHSPLPPYWEHAFQQLGKF